MLIVFVVALVASGLTAFPLCWETRLLVAWFGPGTAVGGMFPKLAAWLDFVHEGLEASARQYPFLAYGTDWLAFAHLVIAVAFWGPIPDPVREPMGGRFRHPGLPGGDSAGLDLWTDPRHPAGVAVFGLLVRRGGFDSAGDCSAYDSAAERGEA